MDTFYGPNTLIYNIADETRQTHGIIYLTLEYKLHEGWTREFCSLLFCSAPILLIDLISKRSWKRERWVDEDCCFTEQLHKSWEE